MQSDIESVNKFPIECNRFRMAVLSIASLINQRGEALRNILLILMPQGLHGLILECHFMSRFEMRDRKVKMRDTNFEMRDKSRDARYGS